MKHRLNFVNNSELSGTLGLYIGQTNQPDGVFSAIFAATCCNAGVRAQIDWEDDLCLVWGEPGILKHGDLFSLRQSVEVNEDAHCMRFTESLIGGGKGVSSDRWTPPDSLCVEVKDVSPQKYSIGIGVNNQGAVLQKASPNICYTFVITELVYFAVFGDYALGQLIDPHFSMTRDVLNSSFSTAPLRFSGFSEFTHTMNLNISLDSKNRLKVES